MDSIQGKVGMNDVSYNEFEILLHEKEELEMQNRRLVERISKLKYILKGLFRSTSPCELSSLQGLESKKFNFPL